ncbi:hypothetical protein SN4111_18150 [Ligilactobacillus agilis]|uniref:hypothetical protein n=1 Tax=Ligilactobacillus agilis TaxID=1601 RepID=UPI001437425B|nr:hypothetical protein [Ligilactobacillus agilis]GET15553.1 hypothetical protein SN4111_18150 [Ligilactobacillus agilis]
MKLKMKKYDTRKLLLLVILFSIVAALSVIPAFYGGYLKVTYDGNVHLSRFESIYRALRAGKVPSSVNFIGFNGLVAVYNSLYPWVSGLLFVVPRFLVSSRLLAWAIGFFFLNFITMANMYILTRELTDKFYLRILGVMIYQLSAYHFTLMYSRMALGEALAYAFLPLVFTGLLRIWNGQKNGILFLGLGGGLIFNSHILSTLITGLILVVIIGARLLLRKVSIAELRCYIYSAGLAAVVSGYTLISFIKVYFTNEIDTPFRLLQAIIATDVWNTMLNNSIKDTGTIFNIGLIETLILIGLTVPALLFKYANWKLWWIGAMGIGILTLNWFPWDKQFLVDSPLGSIQFLGRLLTYVVLFLAISVILFLEENKQYNFDLHNLLLLTVPLLVLGMSATYNYHVARNDDPIRFYPHTSQDFDEVAYDKFSTFDYQLKDANKHSNLPLKDYGVNKTKQTYNNIVIKCDSQKTEKVRFRIPVYNGIDYTVKINGKINKVKQGKMLVATLRKGTNTISITSKPTTIQKITFCLSLMAIILTSGYIFMFDNRKSKYNFM